MIKNRLKEIRMKEYMMSQKDFCEVIKINKRTYSPLEGNKVQGNIENIFKIAKNLNRDIKDIWYEVSE